MDIASAVVPAGRLLALVSAGLIAAGCSGSGGAPAAQPTQQTSTPAPSGASGASAPGAAPAVAGTESPPPGDIPDSTAYVAYRAASGQYEVKVPEGWARTVTSGVASFTDKLNIITVQTVRAAAPTLSSARAGDVSQIKRSVRNFALAGISTVRRPAGTAVLIRYSADSQPDPVTGKVYKNAVERYEFYQSGTEAVLTLAGPAGADNVDPWRTVTSSFRWLR
jgi:hypothetical protein